MAHILNVLEIVGEDFTCQDAILLKSSIKSNLNDIVILDFQGIGTVPTTFFYTLLSDAIYDRGREYIYNHLQVKNLSNFNDYKMVVLGASQNLC
ncbi:MAG: STAS-like domain-containing protein [Clostridiaceae bacterium]|nr:STAS-like domain-containing protein [Clostridiaceae bacterium]